MKWNVTSVTVISPDELGVRFEDGTQGTVRFLPSFFRGVFAHLKEAFKFQEVAVVNGAVTWPGELDLAPDAMYSSIVQDGVWVLD